MNSSHDPFNSESQKSDQFEAISQEVIRILETTSSLERIEPILRLVYMWIEPLQEFQIRDLMLDVKIKFGDPEADVWPCSDPIVVAVLEVCEGQIALRAIRRLSDSV